MFNFKNSTIKWLHTWFVGDWEVEIPVVVGDDVRFNIGTWDGPTRFSRSCI